MKFKIVFAVFFLVGKTMADSAPINPAEIIKNAITARGGKDFIQRHAMVHMLGDGTQFQGGEEIPVNIERWNVPPDRQKTIFTRMHSGRSKTTIVILNKEQAWIKRGSQPAETLGTIDFDDLKAQASLSQYTLLFPLLEDKEIELRVVEEAEKDGEDCWYLLVRRKGVSDTTLAFSKKTSFLKTLRYTFRDENGETIVQAIYSDYRKIGEGFVAHKQETYENSLLTSHLEVKKITPIKDLDEKLFAKPE